MFAAFFDQIFLQSSFLSLKKKKKMLIKYRYQSKESKKNNSGTKCIHFDSEWTFVRRPKGGNGGIYA